MKVKVYDNGGVSFDRYTVIIGREVYSMSDNPLSYNGFNQYVCEFNQLHLNDTHKKIKFSELPENVKKAIFDRKNA